MNEKLKATKTTKNNILFDLFTGMSLALSINCKLTVYLLFIYLTINIQLPAHLIHQP